MHVFTGTSRVLTERLIRDTTGCCVSHHDWWCDWWSLLKDESTNALSDNKRKEFTGPTLVQSFNPLRRPLPTIVVGNKVEKRKKLSRSLRPFFSFITLILSSLLSVSLPSPRLPFAFFLPSLSFFPSRLTPVFYRPSLAPSFLVFPLPSSFLPSSLRLSLCFSFLLSLWTTTVLDWPNATPWSIGESLFDSNSSVVLKVIQLQRNFI